MSYDSLVEEYLAIIGKLQKGRQKAFDDSFKGEIRVLKYLEESGGGVMPSEIGKETGVSSARIAATLNSLEKKGLVTREINKSNRRHIIVNLTEQGYKQIEDIEQNIKGYWQSILMRIGEHDAKELIRILNKLSEILPDILKTEK